MNLIFVRGTGASKTGQTPPPTETIGGKPTKGECLQHYELMYIVDPSIEDGIDEVKQKVEGIITGREGVVISYEKLGKKRLAYPIAKRQYGVYYLVNFDGNGKIVQALEYYLRLNPLVLRYLILVFSEKNLSLRERTSVVQLEEAERMRAGGRPLGAKPGLEGTEDGLEVSAIAGIEKEILLEEVSEVLAAVVDFPDMTAGQLVSEDSDGDDKDDELNTKTPE